MLYGGGEGESNGLYMVCQLLLFQPDDHTLTAEITALAFAPRCGEVIARWSLCRFVFIRERKARYATALANGTWSSLVDSELPLRLFEVLAGNIIIPGSYVCLSMWGRGAWLL